MNSSPSFLDDPRRRNLAILAAVTLFAVLLAVYGVSHQAALTAPQQSGAVVFPGLPADAARVTKMRIRTPKGEVDLLSTPAKGWVLSNHGGFPASQSAVHATLIGLEQLTEIAPRTTRPEWYSYLGLSTPGDGVSGTQITLWADTGAVVADVNLGKTVDIGDPGGAVGLYLRKQDDPQSWLARSVFEPKSDLPDWFDRQVLTIDRDRIAETVVTPASGSSYDLKRDKPADASFQLLNLPKGRALAYDGAGDAVAAALVDFTFDDVKPAKDVPLSNAAKITTRTFSGLTVVVTAAKLGADCWVTLLASGTTPASQKEAAAINRRAEGWAYKLPAYKGQQFSTPLESLLKPLTSPNPPAPK
jgi:hypothetical protein